MAEVIWDEYRLNWPGRLAWLEARKARGTATDDELAEAGRLYAARDVWAQLATLTPETTYAGTCLRCGTVNRHEPLPGQKGVPVLWFMFVTCSGCDAGVRVVAEPWASPPSDGKGTVL